MDKGYVFVTDGMNMWMEEERKTQKTAKTKNETIVTRCTGYYGRIDQLLNGFCDSRLLSELSRRDAKTLNEIVEIQTETRELIQSFAPKLQEAFKEKRAAKRSSKPRRRDSVSASSDVPRQSFMQL
jgi:hypothetical protein